MRKKFNKLYILYFIIITCSYACVQSGTSKPSHGITPDKTEARKTKHETTIENIKPPYSYEEITHIGLTTSKGDIIIKLFTEDAPKTTRDFIQFAEKGNYNQHIFRKKGATGLIIRPLMENEIKRIPFDDESNSLKSRKGTVAVAKSTLADFYVNVFYIAYGPRDNIADRFTIIGEVEEGLEVIDKIENNDEILKVRLF